MVICQVSVLIIVFLHFWYHFFRSSCLFQSNNTICSYLLPSSFNLILLFAFNETLYIPFIVLSFDIHLILEALVYGIPFLSGNFFVNLLFLIIKIHLYRIDKILQIIIKAKIRLTKTIEKFSRILIFPILSQIQSISFVLWPILSIVSKLFRLFGTCIVQLQLIFKIQFVLLMHYFISICYDLVYLFDIIFYALTF